MNQAGWRNDALCTTKDPELFFPLGEGRRAAEQAEVARRVCVACAVRPQCLQAALAMNAQYGVWGGTTAEERKSVRHREPAFEVDSAR